MSKAANPEAVAVVDPQLEALVENFMKRFNKNSSIENAFAGFIYETKEDVAARNKQEQEAVVQLFSGINELNFGAACKLFVELAFKDENALKSLSLLNYLEYLVANNIIPSKPLCEAVLNTPALKYTDRDIWCASFLLVRRIIGGVDYKGCRDIFRAILYKCRSIPPADSTTPQIECVVEVFAYILNRNACLLPSYFAINEIIKLPQHDDKQPLHWAFGKILAEFTQTFRPTVQIVTISGLSHLRPVIGHSNINAYVWRLELRNLKFPNSGPLPYDRDKSPTSLIRYVLSHAYSVDFMTSILIANRKGTEESKHRYAELEDQLCDHIVHITDTQSKLSSCLATLANLRWHNITAHVIFFVLVAMVNLPHMFMQLFKKLEGRTFEKSCARDHIMWMVMQCVFGIGKMPSAYEYIAFVKVYDLLYDDAEPLPVPDSSSAHSVISNAVTCIWVHMQRKSAQITDQKTKHRPIPSILQPQLESLKNSLQTYTQNQTAPSPLTCDFQLAALCNAYSTTEKVIGPLLNYLTDAMMNINVQTTLPHNVPCYMNTEPLTIEMLDTLSVHTKMLLIKHIFSKIDAHAKSPSQIGISPALLETCARLLVYTEIEQTCGIKTFVTNLLPAMMNAKCATVVNGLLEMATYRLTHMQPHYRMKMLSTILEDLNSVYHNQLFVRYENSAACLLLSLGNVEVQQQVHRSIIENKFSLVFHDSEELNRILILTLARAVNAVSDSGQAGSLCVSLLKKVFEHTPHNWSAHTLDTFPAIIKEFYAQNHVVSEDRQQLQRNVEVEFQQLLSMTDTEAIVTRFSRMSERPLFLCVFWKCIMTNTPIRLPAYKILETIGPKALGLHLRTFCDYLATQLQSCQKKEIFLSSTDALRSMMWNYNLFTLDRFLLCWSLRKFDVKDAQVCLFAIQKLLTTGRFMELVKEFSLTAPAQHWKSSKSYEHHMSYHMKYPESFMYEGAMEAGGMSGVSSNSNSQYLPTYFDNICLRMLPVVDVVVHRLIEALNLGPTSESSLTTLLNELSILYKYHDQPVTFLYNTLHYYYKSLKDKTEIKKKLVHGILGCGEKLPLNLVISADMKTYVMSNESWAPSEDYYYQKVKRLVDVLSDDCLEDLRDVDWRFAEFTSAPSHVLYSTCAEFLALPVSGEELGAHLIDVIFRWRYLIPKNAITSWMNAIALLLTTLPEPYWKVIFTCIIEEFTDSQFLKSTDIGTCNPFEVFDVAKSGLFLREYRCSYVLALTHVIWHHASIGQLGTIPKFIKERVKPVVKTEQQFLFVCHLLGPFLPRFQQERAYSCIELTIDLYEILEKVDKAGAELRYMDTICDFFYHLKYMYVGDEPKLEVEKVIKNLRTSLQLRLRFIAHHTTIDGTAIAPTPTN